MKFVHITTSITEDQKIKLKFLAEKTGIERASHIRQAVNDYLKKNEVG
jgi:predicted transcriptional regulator